jgi:hypothetical protein
VWLGKVERVADERDIKTMFGPGAELRPMARRHVFSIEIDGRGQ